MKPIAGILITSLLSAVVLCAFSKTFWYLPLFFVGFAFAFALLFWIVMWVFSVFVRKDYYSEPSKLYQWLLDVAYAFVCEGAGIKIIASGLEKLPDGAFLMVSNHVSNLDNMVQCLVFGKRSIAFIAKEELFRIPIVKGMITRCCYISLVRSSSKRGKSAIETAEDYISRSVCSIGVYPEGHRSKSGETGKFHAGSFKIALNTGCPIVVGAISGTENIKKNFPFRRTKVYFDIIDVVSPVGRKSTELSQEIQSKIAEHVEHVKEHKENSK